MKKIATLFLCCLPLLGLYSQATIQVQAKSATETTLTLSLNNLNQTRVSTPKGDAVIIGFEHGTPLLQAGKPDVAKFATSLHIPNQGNMAVEVLDSDFREFQNVLVAPSKGNLLRTVDPATVPYSFGVEYARNQFFPSQLAELQQAFVMRDVRGQSLWINPVQYNPVTKVLRVYSNITLRVYHTNEPGENELKANRERIISPSFKQLYQKLFVNYDGQTSAGNRSGQDPERLLIIANDVLIPGLESFVAWKRQMGFHTTVVPISEVGTDPAAMYTFVKNFYLEHQISYLLLVGDENALVPMVRPGSAYSCDNCLGYMDGDDHFPEIFVGRFHASSEAELNIMVSRNLEYEKTPLADTTLNWCATGMASASNQGQGFGDDGQADYEHSNEWKGKHLADGFEKYWEFYDGDHASISPTPGDESSDLAGDPVNTQLVDLMNGRGVSLYNYTGHGWEQGLASGNFNTDAVKTLRNHHRYPIVIAVACCAGNFTNNGGGDCLGEAMQRAGNVATGEAYGGIAGFYSSDFQSWSPPMEGQDGMNQFLVDADGVTLDPSLGSMAAYGNALMIAAYGQGGIDMADVWNPFLDPTTAPRTALPLSLSANHASDLIVGVNALTVNCDVEGALVSLYWQGQTLAVGTISGGSVELQFPPLDNVGEILVTVTHFNRIPYQGAVVVSPAAGAFVINESFQLDDSATGNNNQAADYGEFVALNLRLSNIGDQLANATSTTLETVDANVTLIDAEEIFGDILAGNAVEKTGAFGFKVSNEVQDGHIALFKLHIEFNSGQVYESTLPIKLQAPKLKVDAFEMLDIQGGNGNNRLESGETATVTIKNLNIGHSNSAEAIGTLTSASPWLTISDFVVLDPIDALTGTADAVFTVLVSPDAPPVFPVNFQYKVKSGVYEDQKTFGPFTVNAILETFETLTFDSFPWELSGNEPWFVTPNTAFTGQSSSQSGDIIDNGKSIMELTLDFTADGEISFARQVSSELNYDYLRFLIDDVEMEAWSGEVPWSEVSYPITAGIHKISWIYQKDEIVSANADHAWVDDISLPPYQVLVATQTPGQADYAAKLSPNPSAGKTWLQAFIPTEQHLNIALFDCLGHKVQEYQADNRVMSGTLNLELDLKNLSAGLYFVQLQGEAGTQVLKLVKE